MKKVAHMRISFVFSDELEKQLLVKKNCWSGPANKKYKNFNIYLQCCIWKKRKTPGETIIYTCIPKFFMIWSTVLEI